MRIRGYWKSSNSASATGKPAPISTPAQGKIHADSGSESLRLLRAGHKSKELSDFGSSSGSGSSKIFRLRFRLWLCIPARNG